MKKLLILVLMAIPMLCRGQSLVLETGFDAVLVADYQQTRSIEGFCAGRINCTIHETNPFLGAEPGDARVGNYFAAAAAGHAIASWELPDAYRDRFQVVTLLLEAGIVLRNRHIGLKFNF